MYKGRATQKYDKMTKKTTFLFSFLFSQKLMRPFLMRVMWFSTQRINQPGGSNNIQLTKETNLLLHKKVFFCLFLFFSVDWPLFYGLHGMKEYGCVPWLKLNLKSKVNFSY